MGHRPRSTSAFASFATTPVEPCDSPSPPHSTPAGRVRGILRQLRPDVVHAHTVRPYGWQAGLAGYHPYVVSAWGSDVLLPLPGWRGRFWQRRTLSRADLITAVSPYMGAAAIRGGAVADRVIEVQFGVDTRRYVPADVPTGSLRRLGIDERPFVFSPRAIKPMYNHETILKAFAGLGDGHQLVMTSRNADPATSNASSPQ